MSDIMLLIETAPFEYKTHLVEAAGGEKFLEVEGRFQHADLENHNGRIYPMQLWRKVITDPAIIESLEEGSMLGELDHPADGKSSLKNISHIVTGLKLNEASGEVTGRARILNNEWGKQLRSIFEAGGKVGISSRGSGSVRPQGGIQVVQEDFKLNTFDFVVQPSTPNAFPKPKNESTFKSKDESVSLAKAHIEEDHMDSIKRLTELRESVAELTSEPVENISKRSRRRLAQEAINLEIQINRLIQEDSSVATVAADLVSDVKGFRTVLEGDKPDFLKKKDGDDDKSDKKKDSDDDDDDDSDDDKSDKKKDKKKDKEVVVTVKEESVEDALANMEKEPTAEEKLAEAITQRDAAIRQARTTYRLAESALQSTGLVMNALRTKIKALLAAENKPVSESADAETINATIKELREANEKLTARNQRLESIINKVQEKMLEAEKAEESGESATSDASVDESTTSTAVGAPKKTANGSPLPKMGTVKQILEDQREHTKSHGASLAARALGVMTKVRSSHVNRGDQILESKSNVR